MFRKQSGLRSGWRKESALRKLFNLGDQIAILRKACSLVLAFMDQPRRRSKIRIQKLATAPVTGTQRLTEK